MFVCHRSYVNLAVGSLKIYIKNPNTVLSALYKITCLSLQISIPLSVRQLCQLWPVWPTVLQQILAYALPVLFSVYPSLMLHCPLPTSFQRIHFSPNCAVILCNILVFCHPTPNIESYPFLAICHYLLIIFAAILQFWRLSPPSAAWWTAVSFCQVGDNSWWFS